MNAAPEIRLAMLGMIPGNGHPYSWSAIINGFDSGAMAACPYPVIPKYLGAQSPGSVRIPGARVTHIWTDNPEDAPKVAAASLIENVAAHPEEVIGQVDAVIIATDDGNDHVRRVASFVAAGLPVMVDKPLAINPHDLSQFIDWQRTGAVLLSSSGMRYAPEMEPHRFTELGQLRWITSCTCKTWERYGIHALEAVYPLIGPGFLSVEAIGQASSTVFQLHHRNGVRVTIGVFDDAVGSFGAIHVYGTSGQMPVTLTDTYTAFRRQLLAFVTMLRTGCPPFPFSETVELMAVIIAGIRSLKEHREVLLTEIFAELPSYSQSVARFEAVKI